ncbi:MAG: response regulator transcription factor [Gemmatimonadota bacterium]
MSNKVTVILVEDHHLVAEGMKSALQDDLDILACVHTAADALLAAVQMAPDVILLDLSLPDRSGLELISELRSVAPDSRILVVSMHTDRSLAEAAISVGAQGYVPKDAGISELLVAISELMADRRFLSSLLTREHFKTRVGPTQLGLSRLTPRQQQIVRMIGRALSSAEIADQLGLSLNTVAFHRKRIRAALGIDSELGLVKYAWIIQMGNEGAAEVVEG